MSKSYENLKIEREQSTLWIILNRTHRLNSFNDVLLEELAYVVFRSSSSALLNPSSI